ncbi:hypothetical protein LTS08_007264 [Lithohypha guttulata]|nr:hypothetical protein LTS08_007264 [Lithohypha guttulata]
MPHKGGNNVLNGTGEPPNKKRRIDEDGNDTQNQPHEQTGQGKLVLEARDISFSLPQRKKLHLGLVEYGSQADRSFAIQLRNPGTNQVESKYPFSSYAHALRLPVPEKNQKQYNFCLLPVSGKEVSVEPIIWTVNHGPLKSYKIESDELKSIAPGPEDVLENALNLAFQGTDVKLVLPTEKEFASALRESHRKNDIAYHIKAFRGSKEGYLFLLEDGIFFGFKKPLTFFTFNEIESISYTSVLQRTFNLNVTIRPSPDAETQEIEFSMLDQADFAGIDEYVKRHQLQDASLAEARRAKKNGKAVKATDSNGQGGDGEATELEKAQAEIEDEEDELEEDYDPDAEEDDSGSGYDSEEEEYTEGKGRNLVGEELGSEAEDVSVSGDEEQDEDDDGDGGDNKVEEKQNGKNQSIGKGKPITERVNVPKRPLQHGRGAPALDDDDQL